MLTGLQLSVATLLQSFEVEIQIILASICFISTSLFAWCKTAFPVVIILKKINHGIV